MSLHDFIFSNDRRHRLARHICFWVGWYLFSGFVQISFNVNDSQAPKSLEGLIRFQLSRTSGRLLPVSLFCYFITYFLVPRFVRTGNLKQVIVFFFLSVLSLYAITLGCLLLSLKILQMNPYTRHWPIYVFFFNSFYTNINFTGTVPVCCLMLAIKYYKNWYAKQRRSEQLSRENIQAELQVLKAQVHPHFLFNTLNNIYSFVLTGDHRAAGLVDKLSGMIDYMRTEGEHSLVSLEKEIRLIKDYVGLEKVRYGDRLELKVETTGEYENKFIAPLLMIPFVENCFKHGASVMRGNQWIDLKINIMGNQLDFSLSNSKPKDAPIQKNKKSIGLMNVRKRLQLLYPEKHLLEINSTEGIYQAHLVLTLQGELTSEKMQKSLPLKKPAYA
jgi:sensor histidine kinase YesM